MVKKDVFGGFNYKHYYNKLTLLDLFVNNLAQGF